MVTVDALLLGAGQGQRFSSGNTAGNIPKQFQLLADKPVWVHSLFRLETLGLVRNYAFSVPESFHALAKKQLSEFVPAALQPRVKLVLGGERRQDSSRLALQALDALGTPPTRVLIHDACRPFLSAEMTARVGEAILDRSYGAWVPVIPVVDTLKRVENHQIVETVDRSVVHRVQTPQVFEYSLIRSLVERAQEESDRNFTDDASLCEYYGIPVGVFDGDVKNMKLTYEFEKQTLALMLQNEAKACESESGSTFTV